MLTKSLEWRQLHSRARSWKDRWRMLSKYGTFMLFQVICQRKSTLSWHVSLAFSRNSRCRCDGKLVRLFLLRLRCPATNINSIFIVYSIPTALLDCWKITKAWEDAQTLQHNHEGNKTKHLRGFCRRSGIYRESFLFQCLPYGPSFIYFFYV